MTISITNGFETTGEGIFPTADIAWTSLATSPYGSWANWTRWNPEPKTLTVTVFKDAGSVGNRLPLLPFQWQGEVTISLDVSNTVDSNQDLVSPTNYSITESANVNPIAGRYYLYTITLTTDSNTPLPTMNRPEINFDDTRVTEFLENVNTSSLAGTIDARTIVSSVSVITGITVTAKQEGETYSSGLLQDRVYAVPDDYVFQENAIIANVVDKTTPSIRCFDLNGESIDAVVDIYIQGLPSMTLTSFGVDRA